MQGPGAACDLLEETGCHAAPMWRHACPIHSPATDTAASNSSSGASSDPARHASAHVAACELQLPATADQWQAAWALPAALVPRWRLTPSQAEAALSAGWGSYHEATGLSMRSPAALLLHFQLTLAWALRRLWKAGSVCEHEPVVVHYLGEAQMKWQRPCRRGRVPSCCAGLPLLLPDPLPWLVRVAPVGASVAAAGLAGPRAELDALPAFQALSALLPTWQLRLLLIGPDVPDALHGRRVIWEHGGDGGGGSLELSAWQGAYHDVCPGGDEEAAAARGGAQTSESPSAHDAGGAPCLVYAPNAGRQAGATGGRLQPRRRLPLSRGAPHARLVMTMRVRGVVGAGLTVQPSWLPTLRRLARPGGPPVLVTDYCRWLGVPMRGKRDETPRGRTGSAWKPAGRAGGRAAVSRRTAATSAC